MTEKTEKLQRLLQEKGRLAVAYSGGIDSHFLLAAALRALGRDSVLAVLCRGLMMPEAEVCEAEALLKRWERITVSLKWMYLRFRSLQRTISGAAISAKSI